MPGIDEVGGYETPYKRDLETYKKINKYDKRGKLFHKCSLLPRSHHHSTVYAKGAYLEDILRNLEKKANIPKNNLYISNLEAPEKNYSLLYGKVNEYYIKSKKAENEWTRDIDVYLANKGKITIGYISGSVYEVGDKEGIANFKNKVADKIVNGNMSIIETLVMADMANPPKFIGTIFISESCPGVFSYDNKKSESRCVYCGENEKGLKY